MKIPPCFLVGMTLLSGVVAARAAELPNVLLIVADDLGIGDPGCYRADSKIPTPHLDRLAREGLRFTEAYCPVSVCSPTRYALLTGRYPWRSWKKFGVLANWEKPMIAEGVTTLPAMLREAGYHTAGIGKWHLGANHATVDGKPPIGLKEFDAPDTGANLDLSVPISGGPLDRGFDEWFGYICSSEQLILEGNRFVGVLGHHSYQPPPAKGAAELRKLPLVDLLREFTKRGECFLDRQKGARQPFFLYFVPYVPHIPLAVEKPFQGSTQAGEYGDYVHQMDHYLGRLLDALDRNGLAADTLVVFASDNGSQWTVTGEGHQPNAPWAGIKWTIREGGVRTPLLVRWPGRVAAGTTSDQLCGLNDWLATFSAIVGRETTPASAVDSRSLLPVLEGNAAVPVRESLAMRSSGGRTALRRNQWKYIDGAGDGRSRPQRDEGPQLYDLESDPRETCNLHDVHPEIVASMKQELDTLLANPKNAPK